MVNLNWPIKTTVDDTQAAQFIIQQIFRTTNFSINDIELQFYSQTNEDGIILYLFSKIGTVNKRFVEIGVGDGIECNTANLILNHRWDGVLIDSHQSIESGARFYTTCYRTRQRPPKIGRAWVTAENVNDLIGEVCELKGEVDLFSIDIDGMDYWVWKALSCISPRVAVIECNSDLGPNASVAVPYNPRFVWDQSSKNVGMSLMALVNLGRKKGYHLVGRNRYGFNAFFVRDDIDFPEMSVEDYFDGIPYDESLLTRYEWEAV